MPKTNPGGISQAVNPLLLDLRLKPCCWECGQLQGIRLKDPSSNTSPLTHSILRPFNVTKTWCFLDSCAVFESARSNAKHQLNWHLKILYGENKDGVHTADLLGQLDYLMIDSPV
eukprot:TRINITY_DN3579_c0_g1_i1.p1 TRINITY_DN3579_c0_g1~~TRINITY_DN3579_c0_g1_i1.p1  ORF type:complete len:115 (+),score=19.32 TRINITY_DN3579_c0_g1_i1:1235-1579(+)